MKYLNVLSWLNIFYNKLSIYEFIFIFFIKNTSPVSIKSNIVDKIHFEVMYIKRDSKRNALVQDSKLVKWKLYWNSAEIYTVNVLY